MIVVQLILLNGCSVFPSNFGYLFWKSPTNGGNVNCLRTIYHGFNALLKNRGNSTQIVNLKGSARVLMALWGNARESEYQGGSCIPWLAFKVTLCLRQAAFKLAVEERISRQKDVQWWMVCYCGCFSYSIPRDHVFERKMETCLGTEGQIQLEEPAKLRTIYRHN